MYKMVATGTTRIRQNYQNSNIDTRGLNLARILGSPRTSTAMYYLILGAGTQQNRILNFAKKNNLFVDIYRAYQ